MAGLPYERLGQNTPESTVDDYLQRGLRDIQQRFGTQWDEVVKRGETLGKRRRDEILNELQSKTTQEVIQFKQQARQQRERLAQVDQLAQQGGFDATEAKWRMTLGSEEAAAMFPTKREQPSATDQFRDLDLFENKLRGDAEKFMTDPGGRRIKDPWKWSWQEKKTGPMLKVYDPGLNPVYDKKKGTWTSGDYRIANQDEIREKVLLDRGLAWIAQEKQKIMSQPGFATRIRGAMLKTKRDGQGSLADKVRGSMPQPKVTPRAAPKTEEPSGPIKFMSPDGKKSYTVSAEQAERFAQQFPDYKPVTQRVK